MLKKIEELVASKATKTASKVTPIDAKVTTIKENIFKLNKINKFVDSTITTNLTKFLTTHDSNMETLTLDEIKAYLLLIQTIMAIKTSDVTCQMSVKVLAREDITKIVLFIVKDALKKGISVSSHELYTCLTFSKEIISALEIDGYYPFKMFEQFSDQMLQAKGAVKLIGEISQNSTETTESKIFSIKSNITKLTNARSNITAGCDSYSKLKFKTPELSTQLLPLVTFITEEVKLLQKPLDDAKETLKSLEQQLDKERVEEEKKRQEEIKRQEEKELEEELKRQEEEEKKRQEEKRLQEEKLELEKQQKEKELKDYQGVLIEIDKISIPDSVQFSLINIEALIDSFKKAEKGYNLDYGHFTEKQYAKDIKRKYSDKMTVLSFSLEAAFNKEIGDLKLLKGNVPEERLKSLKAVASLPKPIITGSVQAIDFIETQIKKYNFAQETKNILLEYWAQRLKQYGSKDKRFKADMKDRNQFILELIGKTINNIGGALGKYIDNPASDSKEDLVKIIEEGLVKYPGIGMKTALSKVLLKLKVTDVDDSKVNNDVKTKFVTKFEKAEVQAQLKAILAMYEKGAFNKDKQINSVFACKLASALVDTQLSDAHKESSSAGFIALNIALCILLPFKMLAQKATGHSATLFGARNAKVEELNRLQKEVKAYFENDSIVNSFVDIKSS